MRIDAKDPVLKFNLRNYFHGILTEKFGYVHPLLIKEMYKETLDIMNKHLEDIKNV